jgi:MoaA/NifB/PqqE/SkfB family radical SAM enzyme
MANILLNTECNRSCPYCFAGQEMSRQPGVRMSWENLIYIADFLWVNGQRTVSLIGGEPTLHPQCVDFILYLLDRGFDLTLFSNGLLRPATLNDFDRYLTNVLPDRFNIVCNLNDPVQTPQTSSDEAQLRDFLLLMGSWTTPGFNIYRPDFTLDFLFDHIQDYGMKRHLRLGIAHPIPGRKSSFVRPQDMRHVVERLFTYRQLFETYRITLGFDCGFTVCSFSDQELGWLRRFSCRGNFHCSPAVDISPDMSLYHCFPLSNYRRRSLFEFDSLSEITTHFGRIRDEIKSELSGVFVECDGCRHRHDDVCNGGGLCHTVSRFLDEAPIRIREIEDELSASRMPT